MQDSKKKKLLRTVGFLTLLSFVLFILNQIFNPIRLGMTEYVTERDSYYIGLMDEPENTIDVVAMGDSLSFGIINPISFWEKEGVTSYIAGQSGQVIIETYYELKDIFKNQSPKVVIIETDVMIQVFSTEFRILTYQNMYNLLPAARYHELWKPMLGDETVAAHEHFKGFEKRANIEAYTGGEYMMPTDEVLSMGWGSQLYLKKIKKLCDENNAELIMVSLPSPRNYNYAKHNAFVKLSEEIEVPYIDMNLMTDELDFDWDNDMLDNNDHLNIYGTEKVSNYLLDYILKNYDIKSRSDDENARDWDEQAEEFKKRFGIP